MKILACDALETLLERAQHDLHVARQRRLTCSRSLVNFEHRASLDSDARIHRSSFMLDTTRALFAVLAMSLLPSCQFPDYDIIEAQLGGGGADSAPDEQPPPGGASSGASGPSSTAGRSAALPEDCRLVDRYVVCASILDFAAAQAICEAQGRQLLRIDDADENDAVTKLARALGPYVWIGAKKEGDAFEWLDGTVFYDGGAVRGVYSNLVPPPSDEDATLRCVQLEDSGVWTAAHCTDTQQFVCE